MNRCRAQNLATSADRLNGAGIASAGRRGYNGPATNGRPGGVIAVLEP